MLLQTMCDDMAEAPEIYRPTRFWASCVPQILADIEQLGVASFRAHESGLRFYVPSYGDPRYLADKPLYESQLAALAKESPDLAGLWRAKLTGQTEAERDYRIFRAADLPQPPELVSVSQSTYGQPVEHFTFDNCHYSAPFLRYLKCLAFLKKHTPAHRIRNVLEIGGGYGTLGEIFLKSPSADYFYLDVDIPPVAYVATHYLKTVFGDDKVADYLVTRDMEVIDIAQLKTQGYRAAVLCPWQLSRVQGRFELFANSASFQEMEPEVVANYAREVTRLVKGFLLLKNSRHGKKIAQDRHDIGVNQPTTTAHYEAFFDRFELVARDVATFGLQLGGFASEVSIFKRKRGD